MSKMIATAFPIIKGKESDWRTFHREVQTGKYKEYQELRKKQNIRERVYLQKTPIADFVIVVDEGDNPEQAFKDFGSESLKNWFFENIKNIHGVDLSQGMPGPLPELQLDSGGDNISTANLYPYVTLIPKEKEHEWQEFMNEVNGRWKNDYQQTRQKQNVRSKVYLQKLPDKQVAIVVMAGENPGQAYRTLAQGNDDFTRWFAGKVKSMFNYEMGRELWGSDAELVLDSQKQMVTV
ncbi:MAG: hypothetical protein EHM58_16280 [Ignavibacteriae bacterium]|nr:MAG: hypothetical protein EHM58_16280 [Ignavibacteriota bacterium]